MGHRLDLEGAQRRWRREGGGPRGERLKRFSALVRRGRETVVRERRGPGGLSARGVAWRGAASFVLLSQDSLAVRGLLRSHINFRTILVL